MSVNLVLTFLSRCMVSILKACEGRKGWVAGVWVYFGEVMVIT